VVRPWSFRNGKKRPSIGPKTLKTKQSEERTYHTSILVPTEKEHPKDKKRKGAKENRGHIFLKNVWRKKKQFPRRDLNLRIDY